MAVIIEDGQLTLTGYVGESTLEIDGWVIFDGFTHAEVVAALGEIGPDADLTVRINSGGGIATEGTAIRSALAEREGRTDIVVDGIAASAASIIAMAGETVSMSLGSLLMIHDPSGGTWGTVEDHEKTIRALDALGDTYARVYARKSGLSDDQCRDIMRAETWFTPDDAVAQGFADQALDDEAQAVAAYPYQQYTRAPGELVALAQNSGWRKPLPVAALSKPPKAAKPKVKLKPKAKAKETKDMTKPTTAATPPAGSDPAPGTAAVEPGDEKGRIKAIIESDEGKANPGLASHLAFGTDMAADAAIATMKAAGPSAPEGDSTPDVPGYQASRSAAQDLAQPGGGTPAGQPTATIDTGAIYARRKTKGA